MFLMTVKFYEVLLISRFEGKHSFSCLISHEMPTSQLPTSLERSNLGIVLETKRHV